MTIRLILANVAVVNLRERKLWQVRDISRQQSAGQWGVTMLLKAQIHLSYLDQLPSYIPIDCR